MIKTHFHHLFPRICGNFILFAAIITIPYQAIAAIHYVAPGGSCGGESPCYSTIQAAVAAAGNGDEIRVAAGTYSTTSTGDGKTAVVLIINKKITLRGGYTTSNWNSSNPATNLTVIDANDNGICVYIKYQADTSYGDVILDGFSITDGSATTAGAGTDSGGGIYIYHTTHIKVTIQNCKIYENYAEDGSGGGIWTSNSDHLHVTDNEIYDNEGSGVVITYGYSNVIVDNDIDNNAGDGIKVITDTGGGFDMHGNEITNNQGSGISLTSITGGSVSNNVISNNHTTGGGGGLDISGAVNKNTIKFIIDNNTINDNIADIQGGGIDISGSVAEIKNNTIQSNTAYGNGGGGLYVNAGNSPSYVLVSNNQVLSNGTTNQGGGMVVVGMIDVTGNTVTGNTAYSGGGIIATATGTIADNVITNNSARQGGGIRTVNAMGLMIQRNQIIENHATNGVGGGMELWGGFFQDITLDGNQVISNTATDKGGGIYIECPGTCDPIDISNTVLAKNIAATGSGLYSTVCELNMAYTTVASNRDPSNASHEGRGLYLRLSGETPSYSIVNSIIVDQAVGVFVESGSAELDSTLWGSGAWANDADTGGAGSIDIGTDNYYVNPVFANTAGNNYHISKTSPAIDQGADTWISIDMDNEPRPAGETDIGADEVTRLYAYVSTSGACGSNTPCYTTISEAVQAAATDTMIKLTAETHVGGFSLDADKALEIQGGWDASFENQSGTTTLQGAPRVPQGSLTLQNLRIIP